MKIKSALNLIYIHKKRGGGLQFEEAHSQENYYMSKHHHQCFSGCQGAAAVWRRMALLAGTDRVKLTLGQSQGEIDALLTGGRTDIHFN